jgi:5-(carboxyamino)imidazole ribonucleotide synthase
VSQFENHIRAIFGLPILKPELIHNGKMVNIIGDDIQNIDKILDNNLAKIHLYGKGNASFGRKMGHYNIFIR